MTLILVHQIGSLRCEGAARCPRCRSGRPVDMDRNPFSSDASGEHLLTLQEDFDLDLAPIALAERGRGEAWRRRHNHTGHRRRVADDGALTSEGLVVPISKRLWCCDSPTALWIIVAVGSTDWMIRPACRNTELSGPVRIARKDSRSDLREPSPRAAHAFTNGIPKRSGVVFLISDSSALRPFGAWNDHNNAS